MRVRRSLILAALVLLALLRQGPVASASQAGLNVGLGYSKLLNQGTQVWYDSGVGSAEFLIRVKKGEVGIFIEDFLFPMGSSWQNALFFGLVLRGVLNDDRGFTVGMKIDPIFLITSLTMSSSSGSSAISRVAGLGLDFGYRFGGKGIKFTPQLGVSFFSAPYPWQFTQAAFLAAQRYLSLQAGLLVSF